jgi:predicted amidophosphoribosyltransferase
MAFSTELPAGRPLGFPQCPKCPYVRVGPPRICVACASQTIEDIPAGACPVCCQKLADDGSCPNWLCRDPQRRISRIHAIAYLSGSLRTRILRYKYDGAYGWSLIFGRLLLGWLEQHATASPPGLIVANPTYVAPGEPGFAHTERVIEVAAREDITGTWQFDTVDPRAIVKTRATAKSARNTAPAKRAAARELRSALRIPDPSRIIGRSILIYDDVCTTGSQLDAVAACLLDNGHAAHVEAVVLARAPWRSRS